uniref:Galectin n=2 Tax=Caenorhabditis tropicalis TaxID=1561998 RepID=A0A1I7UGY3_9PELO
MTTVAAGLEALLKMATAVKEKTKEWEENVDRKLDEMEEKIEGIWRRLDGEEKEFQKIQEEKEERVQEIQEIQEIQGIQEEEKKALEEEAGDSEQIPEEQKIQEIQEIQELPEEEKQEERIQEEKEAPEEEPEDPEEIPEEQKIQEIQEIQEQEDRTLEIQEEKEALEEEDPEDPEEEIPEELAMFFEQPVFQFNPYARPFIPPLYLQPIHVAIIGDWRLHNKSYALEDYLVYNQGYPHHLTLRNLRFEIRKNRLVIYYQGHDDKWQRFKNFQQEEEESRWQISDRSIRCTIRLKGPSATVYEKCEGYMQRNPTDGASELVMYNVLNGIDGYRIYRKF